MQLKWSNEWMQESSKYKEIVRQHLDLDTIETRVEQGIYSSCHLNFYRDLLLLFNNALVFFPKSSLESSTAHQIARLVSIQLNKETRDSSQEPHLQSSDSLLDKQKSTAPIVVCRKRSSVSAKQSSTSDDKKDIKPCSLLKLKTQEKAIITGTRSSRRNATNKNPTNNNPPPPSNSKKQSSTPVDKQEASKRDNKKKKTEASSVSVSVSAADKKKSVVGFLQRIKKNSPVQSAKKEEPKRKKAGKERQSSGEKKEITSPNKNVGRPPKKAAADTTPLTGKRAREVVVAKRQSKRARTRR